MQTEPIFMRGMQLPRGENLAEPKSIFDKIWEMFCVKAKTGSLTPLLFFIKSDFIEVFDFSIFTNDSESKDILHNLIIQRVQEEPDIEGVAMAFEAFMLKQKSDMYIEEMSKDASKSQEPLDTIVLSLCWRGIYKTYLRCVERANIDEKTNLADNVHCGSLQGQFANFFHCEDENYQSEEIQ